MSNDYLWVEKYRPTTIEETILPNRLKQTFQKIVESGKMPNMLLTGTAGLGKTTVAKALCNELGYDWILINGSDEGRQIDTLRDKIKRFATTVSLTGSMKVVIIDEADYLNCVEENEKILLSNGDTISLKDMKMGEKYQIVSYNMNTKEFETDNAYAVNNLQKETFEVELENGETITVTEDHPFIVEDDEGNISQRTIADGLEGYNIVMK